MHRATSDHLRALLPFVAGGGFGTDGAYLGEHAYGSFFYDPFEYYRRRLQSNPNLLWMGEVGSGKTGSVMVYLHRMLLFANESGERFWVRINDPKGEYGPLAERWGCRPVHLRPRGDVCVNPFENATPSEREGLLVAVASATANRTLSSLERRACGLALADAQSRRPNEPVLLPHIVQALLWPDESSAKLVGYGVTTDDLATAGRDVALELQQFCPGGTMEGMFDGPTTEGIRVDGPVLDLNLKDIYDNHSEALRVTMLLADAWQQSQQARGQGIIATDEGWALLRDLRIAEELQSGYKLCRLRGVQYLSIMHGLSDPDASGDQGSRIVAIARGLVRDSGCVVVYRQPRREADLTMQVLGLGRAAGRQIPGYADGHGLWCIGRQEPMVVRVIRSPGDVARFRTDGRMIA